MRTTCPACGEPVMLRRWTGERTFVEVYECGSRYRWGEGAGKLSGCIRSDTAPDADREAGRQEERAAVVAWLHGADLEGEAENIRQGLHLEENKR